MKKQILLFVFCLFTGFSFSQTVSRLKKMRPAETFKNIHVKKMSDSEESTVFMIWIREDVKPHKHVYHSENILVISGKGEMTLGDEKFVIQKGDFFTIPKNTPHSLKVLSSKPVKVLSIQSPRFKGTDRVYL